MRLSSTFSTRYGLTMATICFNATLSALDARRRSTQNRNSTCLLSGASAVPQPSTSRRPWITWALDRLSCPQPGDANRRTPRRAGVWLLAIAWLATTTGCGVPAYEEQLRKSNGDKHSANLEAKLAAEQQQKAAEAGQPATVPGQPAPGQPVDPNAPAPVAPVDPAAANPVAPAPVPAAPAPVDPAAPAPAGTPPGAPGAAS